MKCKKKLYEKYFKNCTLENKPKYKHFKNLLETIKYKSKQNYYSDILLKFKGNDKKTCEVMKGIIGKTRTTGSFLLRKNFVNNIEVLEENL